MGQHLYPCQCCSTEAKPVYGVAHYRLVESADGPLGWINVLLCTGCYEAGCGLGPCKRKRVVA